MQLGQGKRRRVIKGDEFNKTALAPPASVAPAPAAGKNGARPADEPPTPPAGEGAEAGAACVCVCVCGAGDPAPCKGAVPRQPKLGRRRCEK